MAHLLKFRKGWEREHFAKFILSKISFIAEPSTVADDLGSDLFCTLFKIDEEEKKTKKGNIKKEEYLLPQNSFAIQIKSDARRIDITKKTTYFENL